MPDLTAEEKVILIGMAGWHSTDEIAAAIGCTPHECAQAAHQMGVSLAVTVPGVWCIRCAKWRTKIGHDGFCPVCAWRRRAEAEEEREEQVSEQRRGWSRDPGARSSVAVAEAEEAAYWRRRWKAAYERRRRADGAQAENPRH